MKEVTPEKELFVYKILRRFPYRINEKHGEKMAFESLTERLPENVFKNLRKGKYLGLMSEATKKIVWRLLEADVCFCLYL